MKTKITIEDIHEYLKQWYDNEGWSDFNMAWDSGYTEYAAHLISSGGAINSKLCYEEAKPIERAIERLLKTYSNKKIAKDVKACFGNAEIYVNAKTGKYAFIKNDYVDYLVSHNEILNYGFKKSEE